MSEMMNWFLVVLLGGCIPFIAIHTIRYKYYADYCRNHMYIWSIFSSLCMSGGFGCAIWQVRPLEDLYITLCLLFFLLLASLTDIWTRLIPNVYTYSGIVMLLLMYLVSQPETFPSIVIRFINYGIFFSLLARITGALGLGDVKLIAMASICLDTYMLVFAIWLASLSALLLLGIWLLQGKKVKRKTAIPFAPHLSIGIFISFISAPAHMDWFIF